MPLSAEEFQGYTYLEAEKKLKVLGFQSVKLEAVEDLTSKEAEKDDTVKSVSIGGNSRFAVGDSFPADDTVLLEYHVLRRAEIPLSPAEIGAGEAEELAKRFTDAGFVNVRTATVEDLEDPEGHTVTAAINKSGDFKKGDKIPYDADILIVTHLPSAAPGLTELTAEQIYASCAPAVFYVEIYDGDGWCIKTGSGFFLTEDGIAVTNYHVISGASSAWIVLSDTGEEHEVLGVYDYSVEEDWAILQVEGSGFKTLEVGDQDYDVGGATVYAIGSPLGLQNTISEGIISNPHRMDDGMNYIQMSAAISPGSSGGALLNKYGQVIGITSATYTEGQNLNLAIPMTYLANAQVEDYAPLGEAQVGPSGVLTLAENNIRLGIGEEYDVSLTAVEQNCSGVSVRYSIQEEAIVSCAWQGWHGDDNTLRITGLAAGSTEITVYFLISESETVLDSKTIQVTVAPEGGEDWEADLEDVEFWVDVESLSVSLFAGGEIRVHAVYPPDDENTYVTWYAEDPSLFTGDWDDWDEEGNTTLYIMPQSAGSTELTIGYMHDDGTLLAMRTIPVTVFYAALEVSEDEVGMEEGDSVTLTVTIRSDNPGLHTLRYEIYGEDVVSCSWGNWNDDDSCPLTITGLKSGEADVEIRLLDKETRQFLFSVSIPVFVE
jgi:S1-C subfamily serine protease